MRGELIQVATKEIGTKEFPAGSNLTKYGKWFGLNGVAWCGIFCSFVYDAAGVNLGTIDYTRGFAGTNYAVNNVHKWGKKITKEQALPGDIVFFDFNGDKKWDHVGLFVKDIGNDMFETIEGNTAVGNDSNGGQVMRRHRRYTNTLFVRPNVLDVLV